MVAQDCLLYMRLRTSLCGMKRAMHRMSGQGRAYVYEVSVFQSLQYSDSNKKINEYEVYELLFFLTPSLRFIGRH